MDQLLVATDLSTASGKALVRSESLARASGSRLHVVCVASPTVAAGGVEETRSLMQQQLDQLGVEATPMVRVGLPFVEIIKAARDVEADLIVLGAQGWHSTLQRLLGATAERVVRKGDLPVLVVRVDPAPETYRRVLVGTDLSRDAAEAFRFARSAFPGAAVSAAYVCAVVGEHILALHGASDAELDALRQTITDEGKLALEEWLTAQELDADAYLAVPGDPASELVSLAERRGDDLLVVGSHGLTGPRYLLLGSVAQRVLREAATDVLVVRSGSSVHDLIAP